MLIGGEILTLMLLMWYVTSVRADWADCPHVCQCKWISGKKSALCRQAGFKDIPNVLNTEMQVLDLTGNSIPYLSKDIFRKVGLVNLQRIFLKNSGIQEIHKDAFRELTILVEIDLSDNFISVLHQNTFTGNERLKALYMNGNPIVELRNAQFPHLPHIKVLEFQHCQIKFVHRDAFLYVPALESLSLNGNKLNHISETTFLPVPKLKTLVLDGNSWNCDCNLRSFRNWILRSKLYSHSLKCTYPEISIGKQWEDIDPNEFACAPEVSLSDVVAQGEQGGNVTLQCNVLGDPDPNVSWKFNGYVVDSSGTKSRDNVFATEEEALDKNQGKVSLLTVFNITDSDAGDYICRAENLRGFSTANISLIIPKEAVATTMKRTEPWFVFTAFVSGSIVSVICTILLTCICHARKRSVKNHRRKSKLKNSGSGTISEQDKKLLDASISTTDRQTGSCEGFGSQQDMELMEQSIQSIPIELRDQPVHITIESHSTDPSISVFPPPPEFSTSILPPGAYGNIFISVSVGQEIPCANHDSRIYPDLLDVSKKANASVGTSSDSISYFATLPRRNIQNRLKEIDLPCSRFTPHYDNMGPRITADGSSTISLPETVSIEDIPTPPPPPICSPLNIDYVSL